MEKDESAMKDQAVEDLTVHRAWKGYLFEVLDALEKAGYLNQTRRAKSVTLTEAGLEHARALEAKFLGNTAEGI
jgi:DNA-binding PadR family transcriptional regulator